MNVKTLSNATFGLALLATAQLSGVAQAQTASTAGTVSSQDKSFVATAAQAGLSEVQQGQLAVQKGDKSVQTVGEQMVTDHSKANNQLKLIAGNLGLQAPAAPSAMQLAQYVKLKAVSAATFNSDYLAGQRLAHEHAIALFSGESMNGSNPQLKEFATETLPTLRMHLKMIKLAQTKATMS